MQTAIDLFTLLVLVSAGAYLIIIFTLTLGWLRLKDFQISNRNPTVRLSLVVAARNEAENLHGLFQALESQNYPATLTEIIMVDDHSEDGTFDLLSEFASGKSNVHCLKATGIGKKEAILQAINKATGDLIITTDADCTMGKFWLHSLACFYEKEKPKMIVGAVVYREEKKRMQRFFSLDFLSLVASGAGSIALRLPLTANAANMAISKQIVQEAIANETGQQFSSGDDVFLLHAVAKKYGAHTIRFLKNRRSIVVTQAPKTLKAFLNQRLRWSSKAKGYRLFWPTLTAVTVFLFNLSLSALFLFGFVRPEIWLLFLLLILLKFLTDFPLIKHFAVFANKKELQRDLFLFEFLYPFYISTTALLSFFIKYRWKGRKGLQ